MLHIKMIVGLGNPTLKYKYSRHNTGIWYLKLFSDMKNIRFKKNNFFSGRVASYQFQNFNIRLLIPNIFMNCSGISVFSVSSFYKITLNEILVIHDDLDLIPGVIKLKYGYGHNGHNGLRSIISTFGNSQQKFCRIRIGIGRPNSTDQIKYFVLSDPTKFEKNMIVKAINRVICDHDILINNKEYFLKSTVYNVN